MGVRAAVYSVYEARLRAALVGRPRPRHVAVMLDGNRRWAREEGFRDVNTGHRVGAAKIADLLGWCDEAGVEVVTLFLLSTDNLTRPADELNPLLEIICDVVDELSAPGAPWRKNRWSQGPPPRPGSVRSSIEESGRGGRRLSHSGGTSSLCCAHETSRDVALPSSVAVARTSTAPK